MRDNNSGNEQEKKYFMIKLIPPRPTFAQDMTDEESAIMKQHAAYWKDKTDKGIVVVFGPVLDPNGVYGLGIIEVENEDRAHAFAAGDPSIKSGLNRPEIYLMHATVRK
jgi:uncharacterized protein YciI